MSRRAGSSARRGARRPAPKRGGTPAARARTRTRGRRRGALLALVVVGILVAMSVGPLQTLLTATGRVEVLTASRDQLRAEVDRLEQRRAELTDPEELEIIARSELGLVRPGEEPYIVVRPEDELGQVHPDEREQEPADEPWFRRLGRALGLVD